MVGILPRGYTLTSLEALKKDGSFNVQAGTAFVDFDFLEEVGWLLRFEFCSVIFHYPAFQQSHILLPSCCVLIHVN